MRHHCSRGGARGYCRSAKTPPPGSTGLPKPSGILAAIGGHSGRLLLEKRFCFFVRPTARSFATALSPVVGTAAQVACLCIAPPLISGRSPSICSLQPLFRPPGWQRTGRRIPLPVYSGLSETAMPSENQSGLEDKQPPRQQREVYAAVSIAS